MNRFMLQMEVLYVYFTIKQRRRKLQMCQQLSLAASSVLRFHSFCIVALFCTVIILALRKWLFFFLQAVLRFRLVLRPLPRRPYKGVMAQPCYFISIYSQAARPQSRGRLPVWRWTGCGPHPARIQWAERRMERVLRAAALSLV